MTMDLSSYGQSTLAGWWCDLYVGDWPADFPVPEPSLWRSSVRESKFSDHGAWRAWVELNLAVEANAALEEWHRRYRVDPGPMFDPPPRESVETGSWRDRGPML